LLQNYSSNYCCYWFRHKSHKCCHGRISNQITCDKSRIFCLKTCHITVATHIFNIKINKVFTLTSNKANVDVIFIKQRKFALTYKFKF